MTSPSEVGPASIFHNNMDFCARFMYSKHKLSAPIVPDLGSEYINEGIRATGGILVLGESIQFLTQLGTIHAMITSIDTFLHGMYYWPIELFEEGRTSGTV